MRAEVVHIVVRNPGSAGLRVSGSVPARTVPTAASPIHSKRRRVGFTVHRPLVSVGKCPWGTVHGNLRLVAVVPKSSKYPAQQASSSVPSHVVPEVGLGEAISSAWRQYRGRYRYRRESSGYALPAVPGLHKSRKSPSRHLPFATSRHLCGIRKLITRRWLIPDRSPSESSAPEERPRPASRSSPEPDTLHGHCPRDPRATGQPPPHRTRSCC